MLTNQKLIQACSGLGLNLLEISQFVQVSDLPRIACWGYDLDKKENFIYVNPKVLNFNVQQIQLILKHEILHYAGYRNIEHARDFTKVNVVFDILINKILTIAQEKEMIDLCRRIYNETSKQNILCLARPDVNPRELKNHRRLWKEIWENRDIPSPASIYYQLASIAELDKNPFGVNGKGAGRIIFRQNIALLQNFKFDRLYTKVTDDCLELLNNRGFSSCKFSQLFKELFVRKQAFDSRSVEDFIFRMESRQKLEETSTRIISSLDNNSSRQLYPYELSRIGIIYVACGVSDKLPIFWNKTPESRKNKLAIYIDTSPSMECFQEKEVFLVDRLKSVFPTRIYSFANDIEEISVDDFAKGIYKEGYSTSFDVVIEHLLESEYDAGVVFTDGFSSVNSENEEKFKQSRKRLFTVYFTDSENGSSELDQLSEQTMTITTD